MVGGMLMMLMLLRKRISCEEEPACVFKNLVLGLLIPKDPKILNHASHTHFF